MEKEDISFMAQNALHDSCMRTNPIQPTAKQVEELFLCAYVQDFEWQ